MLYIDRSVDEDNYIYWFILVHREKKNHVWKELLTAWVCTDRFVWEEKLRNDDDDDDDDDATL